MATITEDDVKLLISTLKVIADDKTQTNHSGLSRETLNVFYKLVKNKNRVIVNKYYMEVKEI